MKIEIGRRKERRITKVKERETQRERESMRKCERECERERQREPYLHVSSIST